MSTFIVCQLYCFTMLRLVNIINDYESYPLLVGVKYSLGRKDCDITIPSGITVSCRHAKLCVHHPAGNINEPLLTPNLELEDLDSEFGTFVTQQNIDAMVPLSVGEPCSLSILENIKFGSLGQTYKVDYYPFVVLSFADEPELQSTVLKLGGHFANEWNYYVTHLVMESLELTWETVYALLSGKPIVSPAYVSACLADLGSGKPQPDADDYLPTYSEPIVGIEESAFKRNPGRSAIFAGKIFLCWTRECKKAIRKAIRTGAGYTMLINSSKRRSASDYALSERYIIMDDILKGDASTDRNRIIDDWVKVGRRFIKIDEIGFAVLCNSIEEYCNPYHSGPFSMRIKHE